VFLCPRQLTLQYSMFKMASEDSERVPSNGDILTPGCRDTLAKGS
jgi:hypothetical protein